MIREERSSGIDEPLPRGSYQAMGGENEPGPERVSMKRGGDPFEEGIKASPGDGMDERGALGHG